VSAFQAVEAVEHASGTFTLTGDLLRQTIAKEKLSKYKHLFIGQVLTLDLKKLGKVDTAGLAWLILLIEQAHKKNIDIRFSNLSVELTKLIKLSAVDGLFNLSG
jgi:phospholipid transport system transporter-binding protein